MRNVDHVVTPAQVERSLQTILKTRQIRRNLVALEQAGLDVEYRSVDVSNATQFSALIDDVYERHGRITPL